MRSLTMVWLSSCSGSPVDSNTRGPLEVAGLHLEHVVAAVAVLIDPLADGIAGERRRLVARPDAAVRVDAPGRDLHRHEIGDVETDDDLHRLGEIHHLGHAGEETGRAGTVALSAALLRPDARLEPGLILRCERSLLGEAHRLVRIPRIAAPTGSRIAPLGFEIRISHLAADRGRAGDQRKPDRHG